MLRIGFAISRYPNNTPRPDYVRVDAFLADAATHDDITGVPGAFRKSMRGLEILEDYPGVATLTNTVVTTRSYRQMPALADRLRALERLDQMGFWFCFPMRESDASDLLVSHAEALPSPREALARARRDGRGVAVKNFPECLLGPDSGALCNDQTREAASE